MTSKVEHVTFNNGEKMPIVGLGTWQANDAEVEAAIDAALDAGYRHIDTAFAYKNESTIGKVLKRWFDSDRIKREDLYIVTKLPLWANRAELVEKYMKLSLEALQLTYVDLYLIHHPVGVQEGEGNTFVRGPDSKILLDTSTDLIKLWKAMENQVDAGRTKSIGLSNFNSHQIGRIVAAARIMPTNLQIELHVSLQQRDLVDFCAKHGITVCAYSPLGSPAYATAKNNNVSPITEPEVLRLAAKHNKSAAQVLLRCIIQRGIAVIPKTTNTKRLLENLDVFDFILSDEDMKALDALNRGAAGRIVNIGNIFEGLSDHPEYPLHEPF